VTSKETSQPLARLAALVAAVLVLLAALALARGAAFAHAAAPAGGPAAAPAVFVEDDEDEAEEDEFDFAGDDESDEEAEDNPCASDNEAKEEACEEKLEEEEAEELMADECRLSAAEATVTSVPGQNEVRLTVRYRTFQPSSVAIELRLRGARGPLDLGVDSARFNRAGTVHLTRELSDAEMERAAAAKEFTVGIHAVNSPRFCRGLYERHLTAHKGSRWTDPTATRRAKEATRRSRS
jgi:hypothetical protein